MDSFVSLFLKSGCVFSIEKDHKRWWIIGSELIEFSVTPSATKLSIFAPDFFLKKVGWWIFKNYQILSEGEMRSLFQEFQVLKKEIQLPNIHHFRRHFESAKQQIYENRLKKIVLLGIERFQIQQKREEVWSSLMSILIRSTQDMPVHVYGIWVEEQAILGASPEILFDWNQQGCFRTMALAGTQIQRETQSLLEDEKELKEHQWVVDGILDSLKVLPYFKNLHSMPLELCSVGALKHLRTWIFGELQGVKASLFEELVYALHPTPALGGYPKKEAAIWLQQWEREQKRRQFGAPFGVLVPAQQGAYCLVGIRNLQYFHHEWFIAAGCGVIEQSIFENEWAEILGKIRAVNALFGWSFCPTE